MVNKDGYSIFMKDFHLQSTESQSMTTLTKLSLEHVREAFDRKSSLWSSSTGSVAAAAVSKRSIFVGRLIGAQFNSHPA